MHQMIKSRAPSSNEGFTLIEIFVVMLIIGLMVAFFGEHMHGQTDDSKVAIARTQLLQSLPSALSSFYMGSTRDSVRLSDTGRGKSEIVERGVNPDSPWGGPWQIVADSLNGDRRQVRIRFPMGQSRSQADANIDQLIETATSGNGYGNGKWLGPKQLPIVQEIQEDRGNNSIIISYRIPI